MGYNLVFKVVKTVSSRIVLKNILFVLAFSVLGISKGYSYDFSAVTPNGQTLYYYITNPTLLQAKVVFPGTSNSNPWADYAKPTGHLIIPDHVYNSTNLLTYTVTAIGEYAFYGCSGITELTIGTGITSIGYFSFWNCPSLATVHFNAVNCTTMFSYQTNASPNYGSVFNSGTIPTDSSPITRLTFGSGVNRIPNYAFKSCSQILGVVLPQNLTNIGTEAFRGCENLSSLTVLATTPPVVGNNAFYDVALTIPVFVPCNKHDTYTAADGWSQFTNIIELCSNQITAVAMPSEGGAVSGAGTYASGQSCALSAAPNPGYTFLNWSKNGEVVSTNTTYVFTVSESGNYVASFAETSTLSFMVSVSAIPSDGGTVSGSGNYFYGATCNLTATANTGYSFVCWLKNGAQVSTSPTYSFTVTENAIFTAEFQLTEPSLGTVTITLNPGWNWISYVSSTLMSVEYAFSNLTPSDGDMLKGQSSFCTYNASSGHWSGTLNTMTPGMGYIYLRAGNTSASFTYPSAK